MISIIITASYEEKTIGKSIEAFLKQKVDEPIELICVSPDKGTSDIILSYSKKDSRIKYLRDPHHGKPAALNLALSKAKGRIIVLSDGDVSVGKNSVNELIKGFSNKSVGAVSGRPVSVDSKRNMLGYWAYVLFETAHDLRLKSSKRGSLIHCSGYLYAFRNGLVKSIPEKCLDDGFVSNKIHSLGYITNYSPKAKVFVKNPKSLSDWLKQKIRNSSGYSHLEEYRISKEMKRSFFGESRGSFIVIKKCKNIKELFWVFLLFLARTYVWAKSYFNPKIKNSIFGVHGWQRIESTK